MDQVADRKPLLTDQARKSKGPDDHDSNIPSCDLCSESGKSITATGFCTSCNEFLCKTCVIYHNKFKTNKEHKLLENAEMPTQRSTSTDVDKCSIHPGRPLEMFCSDENILGCAMCFVEGHRACRNVDKISNLAKKIKSSEDMTDIELASIKEKDLCRRLKESILRFRTEIDTCKEKCLADFETVRADIKATLNKIADEVSKEVTRLQKENTEKLDSLAEIISTHEKKVGSCLTEIHKLSALAEGQDDLLFITVKKNKKQISETVMELEKLNDDLHIQGFVFDHEPSIKLLLENSCKVKTKVSSFFQTSNPDVADNKEESKVADSLVLIREGSGLTAQGQLFSFSWGNTEGGGGDQNPYKWDSSLSASDIVEKIGIEVTEVFEEGKMWPFTCMGFGKYMPSIPDLEDISPEELRFEAYNALGDVQAYVSSKQNVEQLFSQVQTAQQKLKNPDNTLKQKLITFIDDARHNIPGNFEKHWHEEKKQMSLSADRKVRKALRKIRR